MNQALLKSLKTPIAIVGMGKSGQAAYELLLACGFSRTELMTFDEKSATAQCRTWTDLLSLKAQTWVVSPGVPLQQQAVEDARRAGVLITSEIGLAARFLTTEKIIGVTGSVGKSTVTSLLGVGAKFIDSEAFVGGNLGTPFCVYALNKIRNSKTAEWIVLELSSYQLENCVPLHLDYSAITYLSANHLERYKTLDDYYRVKLAITQITQNICLMNKTSPDIQVYSSKAQCPIKLVNAETYSRNYKIPQIMLLGAHNRDNFALAAETARHCGWPEAAISAMAEYKGLPHRLEFVGHVKNVSYVNDSKATAMDSVLVAVNACLEGVAAENKLFLLLGGRDKNLPWQDLEILKNFSNIVFVFFGECAVTAKTKSSLSGEVFEKLGHAVQFCRSRARAGDVVLLSPGGTSLDEFKNFEERGHFFKTLVLAESI